MSTRPKRTGMAFNFDRIYCEGGQNTPRERGEEMCNYGFNQLKTAGAEKCRGGKEQEPNVQLNYWIKLDCTNTGVVGVYATESFSTTPCTKSGSSFYLFFLLLLRTKPWHTVYLLKVAVLILFLVNSQHPLLGWESFNFISLYKYRCNNQSVAGLYTPNKNG